MKRGGGPVSKGARAQKGLRDHCELWGALNVLLSAAAAVPPILNVSPKNAASAFKNPAQAV